MNVITIRFTTRWPWNPTSLVISRLGGSNTWSHCMNIIDDIAYEASMIHGCRVIPLAVAMDGISAYQDMVIPVDDIESAKRWGHIQDGKPYDFCGAIGLPFLASDDWSENGKWWCSELCFMQIGLAGIWLLDPDETKRVTPNDLHQCNYKKSEIITCK